MLIDTHCHLFTSELASNCDIYVSDAVVCGVEHFVVPAICAENFQSLLSLLERYPCSVAFGLHPVFLNKHKATDLDLLANFIELYKPLAVGEIGLDGLNKSFSLPIQEELFVKQLRLARKFDLPVLIHACHAIDRVLKYLRQIPVCGGIVHAFNGSEQQANEFLKLGFKLGFGGTLSYEKSLHIRHLAVILPDDAFVLETDAPYMSPSWAQNELNKPSNLAKFAQIMANLRKQTLAHICKTTSYNACQVLRLNL